MAGRIKEECYKPSAVMTFDEKTGLWKGSMRSVEGVDIGQVVHDAKEAGLLEKAGGHKMAAGFSIKEKNIESFRSFVNKAVLTQLNGQELLECVDITSMISLSSVNLDFAEKLKVMEPCGQGNPRPSFLLTSVRVKNIKIQKDKGDSDFLIVVLSDDTGQGDIEAKVFVKKDSALHRDLLDPARPVLHLAGQISVNEFQGRKKVQFDIKDCVRDYVDLPFKKKRSMTKQKKNSPRKRATKTPAKRGPKPR
jgi:single-stranded-DNA-specific exonuclease